MSKNIVYTDDYSNVCKHIAKILTDDNCLSMSTINKLIKQTCSKYKLSIIPKNEHIIKYLPYESKYRKLLLVKPIKTASGVAVITVMPKPYNCPHGKCIYCPGGIEFNTPMSYIGTEPSTKIAQSLDYDPFHQIKSKLDQFYKRGHNLSKIELVVVGGTFPFMPIDYQKNFAKSCFDALNDKISPNLKESMLLNETARHRCVGFTVETKPDYCKQSHIDVMLSIGVTRVEIGVQTLDNKTYHLINRGHDLNDVKESFAISRNAGYKIVAHMMPGLPNSSPQQDIENFRQLFTDPNFMPDMLKIYPTLVLKNTGLHKLYTDGMYIPYTNDDLINVLIEVKKFVPPWLRIMRIQREIESTDILAGPKNGNLRQIVLEKLRKDGFSCQCIRCREIGLNKINPYDTEIILNRIDYIASGGNEIFLSLESENNHNILGFLRLRNIPNPKRIELQDKNNSITNACIVRELHVYGSLVDIGNSSSSISTYQHKGFGHKLMKEAEKIARNEFNVRKLSVISSVGTRSYYKKLGYNQNGPYVTKILK
ncbi:MAG: tRNA uridine(34) 5-carboxymethylaminomethyl modification radical SAM/GNAT enzyme Elp3 [Nitrososphaeraceae archaeon]